MKEKDVGYRDGGAVTPEMQAAFLSKYAHFEGAVGNDKYYSYETPAPSKNIKSINGKAFKVTYVDGKVVQVTKMSAEEAKTIVACSKLKFGE